MDYYAFCRSRAMEEIRIPSNKTCSPQYVLLAEARTIQEGVSRVAASCAVRFQPLDREPENDYEMDGFTKLPMSFQWLPDFSCGSETQVQLQVSVLRTSDNKTAELLNTESQMCKTACSESCNDPTSIYWKQSVEGVIRGFDLRVLMAQSSTAKYENGQVYRDSDDRELQ
jgi:hypothetical protein